MNIPRWIIILIIIAAVWFILKMTGFTEKKVSVFDRATHSRMDKVERSFK